MARSNNVVINILGDGSHAKKVFDDVADAGSKMGAGFAKVGKAIGAGVALGAGAAVAGVGTLVADGAKSLMELERIGAQTSAVIKSTGGAAKVSAGQVGGLADSIEKATGIESEAVREGENLLLTFTGIQNRAGKGNDIFNQTTRIMTDMSVAMGTDVKSGAIQLGKALNDPIKGVSALTKVGVTFTDQQKEQIKALQESGDMAGAQRVILEELNKEFGGSASAFGDTAAGRMAKFKNAIGDIGEQMATALLPVAQTVADFIVRKLIPVFQHIGDAVGPAVETIKYLVDVMKNAFQSGDTFGLTGADGMEGKFAVLGLTVREKILPIFDMVVGFLRDDLIPGFKRAAEFIGGQVHEAFKTISGTFQNNREQFEKLGQVLAAVIKVVAPLLVLVLGAAFRGIGLAITVVIEAVGYLVRAIEWLVPRVVWFAGVVKDRFELLVKIAGWVSDVLSKVFDGFVAAGKFAFNTIAWLWNNTVGRLSFTIPDIPGMPGRGTKLSMPKLPMLAEGGIVTAPTLAGLGEAGAEAVIPLDRLRGVGGGDFYLTIEAPNYMGGNLPRDVVDTIVRSVEQHLRRGGGIQGLTA